MTLDLTKPMRWKSDHTPVIVLWSDDNDTFAEWQPPDDEPVRQHMRTEWFSERVENISPEPPKPVGYDEFDAWLASQMPQNTVIGDPHWWTPKIVRAAIRYLRADLPEDPPGSWSATDPIRSRLPRKVKPLTVFECDLIIEASNHQHSYTRSNVRAKFNDILAERGIEVGE